MSDTKIQWHPAFIAAMNLEMADSRNSLRFDLEYNLNVKPLVRKQSSRRQPEYRDTLKRTKRFRKRHEKRHGKRHKRRSRHLIYSPDWILGNAFKLPYRWQYTKIKKNRKPFKINVSGAPAKNRCDRI